jgi:SAM-dependent methyltransferase
MIQSAPLDVPVFGDWAQLYQLYRPRYPAEVFAALGAALTTDRPRLCIELGAGAGQATEDLLAQFERVEAVEPDAAMAALIPAGPRLGVTIRRGEDCVFAAASADAVVAATAFHWMDQAKVARRAAQWLRPGGVFFAFAFGPLQYPSAAPAVRTLLQRQLSDARMHMHDRIAQWTPYVDAVRRADVFSQVTPVELYADYSWSPQHMAGFLVTTSFGQALARASGDATRYLAGFAAQLADASGGRAIAVRLPVEGVLAKA